MTIWQKFKSLVLGRSSSPADIPTLPAGSEVEQFVRLKVILPL